MNNKEEKNTGQEYIVKKVFNNNVVLARVENIRRELILVGKGLGFAKDQGDIINSNNVNIDKEFRPVSKGDNEKYQQLLEDVDEEIIGLTTEIIAMVTSKLGEELADHIHIALTDHIAFALKRLKEGMEITNPFLHETKTLYSMEYKLAQRAADMIEERSGIIIPESEIGFITLHIHGARTERGLSKTVKYTALFKEMVNIVEEELNIKLSYKSLNYARLITHLRFALERIEKGKTDQNPLLNTIRNDFKEAYKVANKLGEHIEEKLSFHVSEDEKGYLALHLQRLKKNVN